MVKIKKLQFRATTQLQADDSASSRDVWLATWGVVAIFVIVTLVLFFTGNLGTLSGAAVSEIVPEQSACTRGNAVTDLGYANNMIASGAVCEPGLVPYLKCCWWP
jgi:hypothetical protein